MQSRIVLSITATYRAGVDQLCVCEQFSDAGRMKLSSSFGRSELAISNLTVDDAGAYVCLTANSIGVDEKTATITVNCKCLDHSLCYTQNDKSRASTAAVLRGFPSNLVQCNGDGGHFRDN
jgi:Immunoglobulin I-set domain